MSYVGLYSAFIRRGLWFANGTHLQFDCSQSPFVHEQMKAFNTNSLALKLNPSCFVQTHFNMPSTGPGNEVKELKSTHTIYCVPYIICHKQRRGLVGQSCLLAFAQMKQTRAYRS